MLAKFIIVLGIVAALVLCGLLVNSQGVFAGGHDTLVNTAVSQTQEGELKSLVPIRQLSKAQQFLHELQNSPQVVLLFVFALLCVRLLPYDALIFLHLLPWYWRCHAPNKLRVSLWRDSNILIRQTSHSLAL
ncbi:hypothetical protein [Pseudoalteromonas sp. S16_S37]|uniref:hypothetical protein n=1 Tax=Pseudoalteromonas sp. S16_S37 TaxID=2720228 RepID=UPI0016801702|nr:hypothetical protein [Pseudoalteromonas sp. S16_S37]MBD1583020.1 hypothetical protein [Pseudoalteromonas sp. S16_S37]